MSQTLSDPQPNLTTEANQLAANRSTMHAGVGGKLVSLTIIEHTQYPCDADWSSVAGTDAPSATSTRELAGSRGHIRQTLVVGTPPDDDCPVVSLA